MATAQPVPQAMEIRTPIITLRFGGGPPFPESAVTEPTPDEQFELGEQQRLANVAATEAVPKSKLGGILAKVSSTAGGVQAAAEATIRNAHINKNKERFAKNFPQLASAGEVVITDYDCKALHQGQKVAGHLIITPNFLCFESPSLLETIPMREIASIRRSIALATINNGPPFVMITPAPNIVSDTLQLFTIKQQLFQFVEFSSFLVTAGNTLNSNSVSGTSFDRFFNFLDHAWRAATPVPLPGVQYAQA